MHKTITVLLMMFAFSLCACSSSEPTENTTEKFTAKVVKEEKIAAVIVTSMGSMKILLYPNKAPETVKNFVGLAKGTREWIDYKTLERKHTPFYDGLIFHRVIPKFMIQTGDPKGNGTGNAGYRFADEIVDDLKFDRPGLLAMANSGKDTNSSQFFITEVPLPHLNGKHTIFGEVVEGMEVVNAIARVPRDSRDKPVEEVSIKKIRIIEMN